MHYEERFCSISLDFVAVNMIRYTIFVESVIKFSPYRFLKY